MLEIIILNCLFSITSCRYESIGAAHAAISLRWSVNKLLTCLYKDNSIRVNKYMARADLVSWSAKYHIGVVNSFYY